MDSCYYRHNLNVNKVCDCIINGIKEFGMFLHILNSDLDGLCHRSQICDVNIHKTVQEGEVKPDYKIGDRVKAKIVALDTSK